MNPSAIVTGSTKGIGKATASLLAINWVNVVVCSRNQTDIDRTVNEIKELKEKTKRKITATGSRSNRIPM